MDVRRLAPGDERLATQAIAALAPSEPGREVCPRADPMRRVLSDDRNILIVAREADRPVGFLTAYEFECFEGAGSMVYFYEIQVAEDRRRTGIGRAMVDRLKTECAARGVTRIWVGTTGGNEAAQRLFEATGARRGASDYVEFIYGPADSGRSRS